MGKRIVFHGQFIPGQIEISVRIEKVKTRYQPFFGLIQYQMITLISNNLKFASDKTGTLPETGECMDQLEEWLIE